MLKYSKNLIFMLSKKKKDPMIISVANTNIFGKFSHP